MPGLSPLNIRSLPCFLIRLLYLTVGSAYKTPRPLLTQLALLARDGPAKEHPSRISSNLFYLATVIIHGTAILP